LIAIMWRFFALFLLFPLVAAGGSKETAPSAGARNISVNLSRGPFRIQVWWPGSRPKVVVLFGSGDGGWSPVETRICGFLADRGCVVGGIDCRKYAVGDYSGESLAADWASIANRLQPAGGRLPVIYGGWSMGAEQAVPAAAISASGLVKGLLLLSPGARGRYGLRLSDELGVPPMGRDTFALADFGNRLAPLRVAQIHGGGDILDSTSWLEVLRTPHRLFEVPNGWHNFSSAQNAFKKALIAAVEWLLKPDRTVYPDGN
jgi:phosphatidylglycerol lysyltransferase